MSLAPVQRHLLPPLTTSAVTSRTPPASVPPKNADDWEHRLQSELEGSLTYQVIKRLLLEAENSERTGNTKQVEPSEAALETSQLATVTASAAIELQISVQIEIEFTIGVEATAPQKSDPLVIDLGGNGIATSGLTDTVTFDLDADGRLDQISSVIGDDFLLAIDRNNNQRIDDGRELFGDQLGDRHGFAALSRYDDNHDHAIDESDRIFNALRLIQLKSDGSQRQLGLAEAGIRRLDLYYQNSDQQLSNGDVIAQTGRFIRDDGSESMLADVLLQHR